MSLWFDRTPLDSPGSKGGPDSPTSGGVAGASRRGGGGLDDLDAALGLVPKKGLSGANDLKNEKKKVVDPFASSENTVKFGPAANKNTKTAAASTKLYIDSDSDSDRDYKPSNRYAKADTYGNTKKTTSLFSPTAAAEGSSSAAAAAGPLTAPSRVESSNFPLPFGQKTNLNESHSTAVTVLDSNSSLNNSHLAPSSPRLGMGSRTVSGGTRAGGRTITTLASATPGDDEDPRDYSVEGSSKGSSSGSGGGLKNINSNNNNNAAGSSNGSGQNVGGASALSSSLPKLSSKSRDGITAFQDDDEFGSAVKSFESDEDEMDVSGIVRWPSDTEANVDNNNTNRESSVSKKQSGSTSKSSGKISPRSDAKKENSRSSPVVATKPPSSSLTSKNEQLDNSNSDSDGETFTSSYQPSRIGRRDAARSSMQDKEHEEKNEVQAAIYSRAEETSPFANEDDKPRLRQNSAVSEDSTDAKQSKSKYGSNPTATTSTAKTSNNLPRKAHFQNVESNDSDIDEIPAIDDDDSSDIKSTTQNQRRNTKSQYVPSLTASTNGKVKGGDEDENVRASDEDGEEDGDADNVRRSRAQLDALARAKAESESKLNAEIERLHKVLLKQQKQSTEASAQLLRRGEDKYQTDEMKIMHLQDQLDAKRIITQLEQEISRLKDDLNIKVSRHNDDLKQMRNKYENEILEMRTHHDIEVSSLERRHKDSIAALKSIHEDELTAAREKIKSGEVFENIAGQMRHTSGSIKLIEEQLNARHRMIEATREGHIDAREKLLEDLEKKAKERVEAAEAEGYRLKGILSHMEQVMAGMRSQGADERERLKQEHARLEALQKALEAEKMAMHARNSEDLAYIKQRAKDVDADLNRLMQEKRLFQEERVAMERKVDQERADLASEIAAHKRNKELHENKFQDDEAKLNRAREELNAEKRHFERRKAAAMEELEISEHRKELLNSAQDALERDAEAVKSLAREYKLAAEELAAKQHVLEQQEKSIEEREHALKEGFASMKIAASELAHRERLIQDSTRLLEDKHMAWEQIRDKSLYERGMGFNSAVSGADYRSSSTFGDGMRDTFTRQSISNRAALVPRQDAHYDDDQVAPTSSPYSRHQRQSGPATRKYEQSSSSVDASQPRSAQQQQAWSQIDNMAVSVTNPHRSANYDHDNRSSYSQNLNPQVSSANSDTKGEPWMDRFKKQLRDSAAGSLLHDDGDGTDRNGESLVMKELKNARKTLTESKHNMGRVSYSTSITSREMYAEQGFLNVITQKKQLQARDRASP